MTLLRITVRSITCVEWKSEMLRHSTTSKGYKMIMRHSSASILIQTVLVFFYFISVFTKRINCDQMSNAVNTAGKNPHWSKVFSTSLVRGKVENVRLSPAMQLDVVKWVSRGGIHSNKFRESISVIWKLLIDGKSCGVPERANTVLFK